MRELEQLFEQTTHEKPSKITELSPAGSNRRYYRMEGKNETFIGVEGTSLDENKAFIALANHFTEAHLPVPQVLAHAAARLYRVAYLIYF